MTRRVGVIGLGNMGSIMAGRLLAAGFDLWVHNRSAVKGEELVAAGAHWVDDAAAMAGQVELLISIVSDDEALRAVMLSDTGVLAREQPGLTVADMSTVSTQASAVVAEAAAAASVSYLRAPVTGSTSLAAAGALRILTSGPAASVEKFADVFAVLASRVFHLGTGEEARVMKLALNMLVATTTLGLSEALVLGERAGLDWQAMLDVFCDSAVASPLVKYKAATLANRDFSPAFTTAMMTKDLDLALDLARRSHTPTPATALNRELLQTTTGLGWGEHDFTATVLMLEAISNTTHTDTERMSNP